MKNKTILRTIGMLLIVVVFLSYALGCSQKGLEKGFASYGGEQNNIRCAYKSDTRRFDINNVTLTFYYGSIFSEDILFQLEDGGIDYSEGFDIYFKNDKGDKILVKSIHENFVSEEYRITFGYDNNDKSYTKYRFNHSETLTIPKELFSDMSGRIDFYLYGRNTKEKNSEKTAFCSTSVYYGKSTENKVVLSEVPN